MIVIHADAQSPVDRMFVQSVMATLTMGQMAIIVRRVKNRNGTTNDSINSKWKKSGNA